MKFLKWTLIVLLGIVALAAIFGFLSPRISHVDRSLVISADSASVFALVNSPAKFRTWSPWSEKDPNMKVDAFGPETGVGAGFNWQSEVSGVGDGTWKVSDSHPYRHVGVDLDLGMGIAQVNFHLKPMGEKTEVMWSLDIDNGMNPFGRLFGMALDGAVGPDYEKGLQNLEKLALKLPKGRVTKIEEMDSPERYSLVIRTTTPTNQIGNAIAQTLPKVMDYMIANHIDMPSTPFAFYHRWDPAGTTEFSTGMFVSKPEKGSGDVQPFTIYKNKIVAATYFGPYEKIEVAYKAIDEWAKKNNKVLEQSPWEEYITDPGENPDPATWETKVCFVVRQ